MVIYRCKEQQHIQIQQRGDNNMLETIVNIICITFSVIGSAFIIWFIYGIISAIIDK